MKRALVAGASGFIGAHLVKRLKKDGFWVRAVSRHMPAFATSPADEFELLDLRHPEECLRALTIPRRTFDEVYQLSADMGGIGFITMTECDILKNNALINIHMIDNAVKAGVKKYFFSSTVCVYRDMRFGEKELREEDAIPANPDNEYGWEKIYAERLVLSHGRKYGIDVRVARLQTTYGPEGVWQGGREKAPAAICRKVALARDGESVDIWGDGSAVRSYLFINDLLDALRALMDSSVKEPVNIGSPEYVSVEVLAKMVIGISGKKIGIHYVDGPVGVLSRNFSNERIYSLGWKPRIPLREGLDITYQWICDEIEKAFKRKA